MDFKLLKERDMKLLSRKRLTLMIENREATPSRKDLIKAIAEKYKTKEDLVIIKHIYPQFGQNKTKLIVHLYQDKDKMNMFEHKNLLKKHREPEKKETENPFKSEKPVDEASEEKVAEESKESSEEQVSEEDAAKAETKEESVEQAQEEQALKEAKEKSQEG
jgi:ribosomal protein S24E